MKKGLKKVQVFLLAGTLILPSIAMAEGPGGFAPNSVTPSAPQINTVNNSTVNNSTVNMTLNSIAGPAASAANMFAPVAGGLAVYAGAEALKAFAAWAKERITKEKKNQRKFEDAEEGFKHLNEAVAKVSEGIRGLGAIEQNYSGLKGKSVDEMFSDLYTLKAAKDEELMLAHLQAKQFLKNQLKGYPNTCEKPNNSLRIGQLELEVKSLDSMIKNPNLSNTAVFSPNKEICSIYQQNIKEIKGLIADIELNRGLIEVGLKETFRRELGNDHWYKGGDLYDRWKTGGTGVMAKYHHYAQKSQLLDAKLGHQFEDFAKKVEKNEKALDVQNFDRDVKACEKKIADIYKGKAALDRAFEARKEEYNKTFEQKLSTKYGRLRTFFSPSAWKRHQICDIETKISWSGKYKDFKNSVNDIQGYVKNIHRDDDYIKGKKIQLEKIGEIAKEFTKDQMALTQRNLGDHKERDLYEAKVEGFMSKIQQLNDNIGKLNDMLKMIEKKEVAINKLCEADYKKIASNHIIPSSLRLSPTTSSTSLLDGKFDEDSLKLQSSLIPRPTLVPITRERKEEGWTKSFTQINAIPISTVNSVDTLGYAKLGPHDLAHRFMNPREHNFTFNVNRGNMAFGKASLFAKVNEPDINLLDAAKALADALKDFLLYAGGYDEKDVKDIMNFISNPTYSNQTKALAQAGKMKMTAIDSGDQQAIQKANNLITMIDQMLKRPASYKGIHGNGIPFSVK